MPLSLPLISQQITIYLGIPILITGIIGGLFNAIVFLSLRTFRENSCAYYMTIMSCANIGQLATGLLTRVMITGFNIDWTRSSSFYCKVRVYFLQLCGLISVTSYCLATIDQYLATCSRPHWQRWCTTKVAIVLTISLTSLWILHGVPFLLFYDTILNANTGQSVCTVTNLIFARYATYVYQLVLVSSLPVFVSVLFGFLAYRNVQQLAYRTIPLVRRELDKQLTNMVLCQVLFNIFTILPYFVVLLIFAETPSDADPAVWNIIQFANSVVILLYYIYYANPFFLYIIVSDRFRRQFIYVLCHIRIPQWQPRRTFENQVEPHS